MWTRCKIGKMADDKEGWKALHLWRWFPESCKTSSNRGDYTTCADIPLRRGISKTGGQVWQARVWNWRAEYRQVSPSIAKYGRQEYDDARDGSALLPVGPIYAADLSQPVSFAQKLIKLQKVPTHVVQLSRAKLMQNMQMRSCHAKKKLASSKLR